MNDGRAGEDYAAQLLTEAGFRVVERNFHSRFGEIDIIAENEKYIIFVEVKTRREGSLVEPFASVTPAKQRRLVLTAQVYLQSYPTNLQPRFDVCGIIRKWDGRMEADYLADAFDAGGLL